MGNINEVELDRRSFLKGAALTGAALASAGLVACGPAEGTVSDSDGTSSGTTSSAAGTQSTRYTWEARPDSIPDSEIVETVECDIAIVGAGVAGIAAFMTACEAGATVALIEKGSTFSARGMDHAAIGTKLQASMGIEIDKAAVVNDLVTAGGYKVNGQLIQLWANKSGEVYDDLIDMTEADGLTVTLSEPDEESINGDGFWNRRYPVTHMLGAEELGNGKCQIRLCENMIARALSTGGGTEYYGHKAEQLVESDGKVEGVITGSDNGYVLFKASKAVILSTGDYLANNEMVDAWCPILKEAAGNVYNPVGANTGDGHQMALWVGAGLQKGAHGPMVHPIMGGGACGTYSFMRVNKDGNRFCNEDTPLPGITNAYMTSPGHVVWTIMDADFATQIPQMSSLSRYNGNTSGPFDPTLGIAYEEGMDMMIEEGTSVTANTIEGLAQAMGVPEDSFSSTVARYNELAILGRDEDFAKNASNLFSIEKAPFYASQVTARTLVVTGGLNVDGNLAVCTPEGVPIEGLYSVGNTAGNFFADDYPMSCPGISHGRAITLGYLLGKSLATGNSMDQ